MVSPMKMSYKSKGVLSGLPALNTKKASSETGPKVMKGARSAGAYYKSPGSPSKTGKKSARDESSANTTHNKPSASDKNRYTQAKQPVAYSNDGPKATTFVC